MGLIDFGSSDDNETAETETERAVIEGEYDPTKPKRINSKEWWIERINEVDGELDTYAGAWPRAMIENAAYEPRQPLWFGCSERTGREFGADFDRLFQHVAYLGSTGAGKTTAVHNSVIQLIMGGHGVGIVDPKGDDVIELLRRIPKRRWDDVVYVDIKADHWTLEDENGEEVPHHIGFNILETYHDPGEPGYDQEVEWIVSNFMKIAGIRESWSLARRVLKTIVRWMTRQEDEYTIIEVFYAILNEENRAQFSDLLGDHVDNDDILFIESYLRQITDNMSSDQLDPLIGELADWVQEPMTRKVVAQRDAGITLGEIISEQKILVVNNDLSDELREKMANVIMTGVWSAVTGRRDPTEHKLMEVAGVDVEGESTYSPFFLSIDECHAVFSGEDNIESMLMEARSKKLGLLLSTQTLRSLPDQAAHAMVSNCNTVLSMEPGDPDEARLIADKFGDVDPAELQRTPEYHALTQMNSEDDPFLAKMIPPYPPRHTIEETHELIMTSLENYGTPARAGLELLEDIHFDVDDMPMLQAGADGEMVEDPLGGDEEAERVVLKRVYDEQIMHGETVDASEIPLDAAKDAIKDEFELGMSQTSNLVEMLENKTYLRTRHADDGMRVSVAPNGIDRIGLDTGSGGSGGGSVHRYLLRRMYIELTRLGYNVDLPDQNDPGELPDAVGNLPPELDDMSLSKAIRTLKEEYPAIRALSGDAPLVVEAESKGISKPGGPVKNLAKAPEDQSVMFVVADGGSDGFTNNARRLANIFVDAPFTNPRCPADAERKFYTKNPCPTEHTESIDIKAGTEYAIHPDPDASTQWVEMADGSIVCREVNGEDLARYDDLEAFTNRSGEQFPGVAYYDRDKRVHVAEWVDESGERQRIKRGSKSELRKEVSVIQAPVIPEVLFDGDVPSPEEVSEDVDIVIVPNEPEDEDAPMPELEVYDIEAGETEPLSSYLGVDLGERGRVGDVPEPEEDGSDEGATDDEETDLSEMTIEERMKELGIGDE